MTRLLVVVVLVCGVSDPAFAQGALGRIGQVAGKVDKAKGLSDQIKDLVITEQEEKDMGEQISARLREKYGVVQSAPVHKYVSLVGRVMAGSSTRPTLAWTFIVLDTDGVNAFAAPGGYIHITRGALALIQDEAELAGVLGHEIIHVTEKHTINAIKKAKVQGAAAEAVTRSEVLEYLIDRAYENLLENRYDRGDETGSDQAGIRIANGAGYAPSGLGAFLTRLSERNKDLKEPSGVFASHPETRARVDRLTKQIASGKLAATATVAARYKAAISYKPVAVTAVVATKTTDTKPAEPKSKFGLGGLSSKLGVERTNTGAVASAGSRGVNPDRDAKGGSNARGVTVTLTPAEIAAFRKGITG